MLYTIVVYYQQTTVNSILGYLSDFCQMFGQRTAEKQMNPFHTNMTDMIKANVKTNNVELNCPSKPAHGLDMM